MVEKILNYLGQDGLLHILASVVLMNVLCLFLPLWVAIIATTAIGIGKELVWDKWMKKGTFDRKDLLCDGIGILLGCI